MKGTKTHAILFMADVPHYANFPADAAHLETFSPSPLRGRAGERVYPTEFSILRLSSFCASTANSIGSFETTSLA